MSQNVTICFPHVVIAHGTGKHQKNPSMTFVEPMPYGQCSAYSKASFCVYVVLEQHIPIRGVTVPVRFGSFSVLTVWFSVRFGLVPNRLIGSLWNGTEPRTDDTRNGVLDIVVFVLRWN
jgi:hypothetical protein